MNTDFYKRYFLILIGLSLIFFIFFYFNLIFNQNSIHQDQNSVLIEEISSNQASFKVNLPPNLELKYRFRANLIPNQTKINTIYDIDKGSQDGVEIGNAITNKDGQLLGVIVSSDLKKSTVQSVTNPAFRIPVWLKNESNKGLMSGLYNYSAEIDWIRDGNEIDNLPVYTTNINPKTFGNIFIGYSFNSRIGKSGSFFLTNVNQLAPTPSINDYVLVW